jgi:putative ABC transport system permease protein
MIKNYLKIAWRNLLKDRQFTLLNIIGLSTGLACALLIGLWISDEKNMERYNDKDEQLYQVMTIIHTDGGIKTIPGTPGILAKALQDEVPEVEQAVSVLPASWFPFEGIIKGGSKQMKAAAQYIGKGYFDVFNCQVIAGDKNRLLTDKAAVAISTTLAKKLFNSTNNVIGKTIQWDQQEFGGSFIITALFERNPPNATEQFDLLFNYDLVLERRPGLLKWGNADPSTFLLVKKGVSIASLNNKLKHFIDTKQKKNSYQLLLTRFSDRYLYNRYENGVQAGGRIVYVRLFTIIAIFILVIACINFMNLSTAKAARRAREVGIQKVMGARRGSLMLQYLGESVLMAFLSLLLALVLLQLLLPLFNSITGKQLFLQANQTTVLYLTGITLLTGFVAGSYPALYLSRFKPVTVLKGKLPTSVAELWTRKGLVVFQFTLSIVFIAAVLIIYRQVSYIQSKNLGYNKDHIIHFEIPLQMDSTSLNNAAAFVQRLNDMAGVVRAGSYYHNLTGDHGSISDFTWPGKNKDNNIEFSNLEVGYGFLETVGIQIKEGRDFSKNERANKEIIFNETAINMMGLKDPVGKKITFWGQEREIIGVAGDFNFESLYSAVKPCFFQAYPVMPNVMVKMKAGHEKETIERIQQSFAAFQPGMTFDYRFLDEDYQALYASETKVSMLSRCFAGLAIVISCLGLFGLVAFSAQRRQKEIGIRKVAGASVSNITVLLSKEFIKLVLLALAIAFPIIWLTMNNWLQAFAYRITIGTDIFIITSVTALVITCFTVSFQSIKAALMNPVKSLREV